MKNKYHKFLDNTVTYLFSALLFFTPLILYTKTSEVFEFNKITFLYLTTGLITASFLLKSLLQSRLKIKKTPLNLPLFLFFLGQLIATIFSLDTHTSLWGYYSRFHGGLVSTINYSLLFIIFTSHFSQKQNKRHLKTTILYSLLAGAFLVALYATMQHFGIDKNLWVQDVQNRVFSTLGQPNWLSAYLVALLPLPIFLYFNNQSPKSYLFLALSILLYITILFTKSRSGIGTTFIILLLSFTILSKQAFKKKNFKSKILTPLLALLLTSTIIGTPWSPNPTQINHRLNTGGPLWPQAEPFLQKLNLTTQVKPLDPQKLTPQGRKKLKVESQGKRFGGSNSFDIRKVVWTGAWRLFKKYPLTGSGVETFGYAYYQTRPKAHNLLSEWDFLYNKAHNEYLNFLSTTGLIGTLPYLLLIIATLITFFKPSSPLSSALTLGYTSLLITNFFGFSVVPTALLFFLYPAFHLTLHPANKKHLTLGKQNSSLPSILTQLGILTTLILTFFWSLTVTKHWLADIKYQKGKSFYQAGYLASTLPLLEKSVSLYPNEPTFHAQLAKAYSQAALATQQQLATLPATQAGRLKPQAQTQINQYQNKSLYQANLALEQNPHHLNFYKAKAQAQITLAQINPDLYPQAIDTLIRAAQKAPTDPKLLYNLGLLYQQTNQTKKAQTALQKALELKPDYQKAKTLLQ